MLATCAGKRTCLNPRADAMGVWKYNFVLLFEISLHWEATAQSGWGSLPEAACCEQMAFKKLDTCMIRLCCVSFSTLIDFFGWGEYLSSRFRIEWEDLKWPKKCTPPPNKNRRVWWRGRRLLFYQDWWWYVHGRAVLASLLIDLDIIKRFETVARRSLSLVYPSKKGL